MAILQPEATDSHKGDLGMIRVYFVYEDPIDETGVNLSFVDVLTRDPRRAILRVHEAADTGELWKSMYPRDKQHPYTLIKSHISYLDISALSYEVRAHSVLALGAGRGRHRHGSR
jgi:hypothetical protein